MTAKLGKESWGSFLYRLFRNPWIILLGALAGVVIGLTNKSLALAISPFGKIYLSLLGMCVLPILISAVTISIAKLINSGDSAKSTRRIFTVFAVAMLLSSLVGLLFGLLLGPGRGLGEATLRSFGVLVNESAINLQFAINKPTPPPVEVIGLKQFVTNIFPDNIFKSLSEGNTLQVLVFSMVFGFTLAIVNRNSPEPNSTEHIVASLDIIYKSFNKLISALIVLLPIGLCSLLANQIAKTGLDIVIAMVGFIISSILVYLVIYTISTLIISRRSKRSLRATLVAMNEPTVLALATANALACLPYAINTMSEKLNFSRRTIDLVIPLGISIGRFGQVAYFSLATIFVAQLYRTDITLTGLVIVVIGSALAGLASSGATGLVTLSALGVVLQPLGLPVEAVLALFIAIDPILDPLRTLCTLHTTMAATAMIAELKLNSSAELALDEKIASLPSSS